MKPIRTAAGERRREKRYQVDLPASIRSASGDQVHVVAVSDLSASGALIDLRFSSFGFQFGEQLTLLLDEFGAIEAQVVHVGTQFYGLQFLTPHLHRDRLTTWLQQEANAKPL